MGSKRKSTALLHRRVHGVAGHNARALFGLAQGKKMESPEQREDLARVLLMSGDEVLMGLAREALRKHPDPSARDSFVTLMEKHRVTLHAVSTAAAKVLRAEGFLAQAQRLPELMVQAADDAASRWELCDTCDGEGTVPDTELFLKMEKEAKKKGERVEVTELPKVTCKNCKGEGRVYTLGDIERLKLVFETHGLTGKNGAGINILNVANAPAPGEKLHELSGTLAGIIEGEVK